MQDSYQYILNAATNWIRQLVIMVVALFLLPYLLHALGDERYGIYGVVASVISMLGMVDLGLAGSVTRFTSRDEASGDPEKMLSTTSTAFATMGLIAFVGGVLSLVAIPLIPKGFEIPQAFFWDMAVLTAMMGMSFVLRFLTITSNAVIISAKRQDIANGLLIGQVLLRAALTVTLIEMFGPRLAYVGLGIVGSLSVMFIASVVVARYVILKRPVFRLSHVRKSSFARMAGYGAFNAFAVLSGLLIDQGLNILIGALLGTAMVAAFAAPLRASMMIRSLVTGLAQPILPFAGRERILNEGAKLGDWLLRSSRLCCVVALAAAVPATLMSESLLRIWVGPEYAWTAPVLIMAVIAGTTQAVMSPGYFLIAGGGSIRAFSAVALAFTLVAFASAIASHYVLGGGLLVVTGSALGVLSFRSVFLIPLIVCRQFKVSFLRYLVETYGRPALACVVPAVGLFAVLHARQPRNLLELLAYGTAFAVSFTVFAWVVALSKPDRALIIQLFGRMAKKRQRARTPENADDTAPDGERQ